MSKVIRNITVSPVTVADCGVTIPATSNYTIPSQDYPLWAASNNVITFVGAGTLIVNDGFIDLSISDGTDWIKNNFPTQISIRGDTNGTKIGNLTDRLKVYDADAITVLNLIALALGAGGATFIERSSEANITTRTKTDWVSTYTVASGKKFILTSFSCSYDAQGTLYVRLEKQTGGTGAWVTKERIVLMAGGNSEGFEALDCGVGIQLGTAGDVFKITVEASLAKGTAHAQFAGNEI